MCGRYASSREPEELAEVFEVEQDELPHLAPDWNVAPTKEVYAVVQRPPAGEQGEDGPAAGEQHGEHHGERQLRAMSWGLVPFWAKDRSVGSRMINARVETVAEKPAYRRAFERRRAILPADGYYEWYVTEELTTAGRPRKQPYFIRPRDGGVLAMAGLYEIWRDPTRDEDDPHRFWWSTTVITTNAEDELGRIHERMPMMLAPDRWADWLDPAPTDRAALLDLLQPALPGALVAQPVAPLVSNVRNNGPELVAPIPLES
ncbi:MAG: SOS response-associated peptidase [Marmoricola sp.]